MPPAAIASSTQKRVTFSSSFPDSPSSFDPFFHAFSDPFDDPFLAPSDVPFQLAGLYWPLASFAPAWPCALAQSVASPGQRRREMQC